jgi:hypothetical protein
MDHAYADQNRFGQGPNWRLRTTRAALAKLGFDEAILRHGLRREVFIAFLADNAAALLKSGRGSPQLSSLLPVHEVAQQALVRWVIPRSHRKQEFRAWNSEQLASLLRAQNAKEPPNLSEAS